VLIEISHKYPSQVMTLKYAGYDNLNAGDFKKVAAAIKLLTNEQIEEFVKSGGELELEGHKVAVDDIRVIYQFAQDNSKYV